MLAKKLIVIALNTAGAFDRVWHKRHYFQIQKFWDWRWLKPIKDYLRGRTLQVVVNGYAASESPITASAPQGSVIGPLIWNVCFSDILHLIPAYYHLHAKSMNASPPLNMSLMCYHLLPHGANDGSLHLQQIKLWSCWYPLNISISTHGKTLDLTEEISILGCSLMINRS